MRSKFLLISVLCSREGVTTIMRIFVVIFFASLAKTRFKLFHEQCYEILDFRPIEEPESGFLNRRRTPVDRQARVGRAEIIVFAN